MSAARARQIVLAARPHGKPRATDFRLEETAVPGPGPGQVLLRVQHLSLDRRRPSSACSKGATSASSSSVWIPDAGKAGGGGARGKPAFRQRTRTWC